MRQNLALIFALVVLATFTQHGSCQRSEVTLLNNVVVSWENLGTKTVFNVSSPLGNSGVSPSNAWLGIGIGDVGHEMEDISPVICRNGPNVNSLSHNRNTADNTARLDNNNPLLGLSDTRVTVSGNNLVCSFARANTITPANSKYIPITANGEYYIVVAYGTGEPSYHGRNRAYTANKVKFTVAATTSAPTTTTTSTTSTTSITRPSTSSTGSSSSSSASSSSQQSSTSRPVTITSSSNNNGTTTTAKPSNQNAIQQLISKFCEWWANIFKH